MSEFSVLQRYRLLADRQHAEEEASADRSKLILLSFLQQFPKRDKNRQIVLAEAGVGALAIHV